MRLPRRAGWLVLTLLAAGTSYLHWGTGDDLPPRPVPAGTPEHVLEGFDARNHDEHGLPTHTLRGARLARLSGGEGYRMQAPEYTLAGEPGTPPWTLRAPQAWSQADFSLVRLEGETVIERAAYGETPH
jgi:LPS export ABC transporter protein LptC